MLDFVKNNKHKIGYIIVHFHDRFSRSGTSAAFIADQLRQLGISLLAVAQPVDTSTAMGMLMQQLYFSMSHLDNHQRKERYTAGMLAMVRKGCWPGKAPMGYDLLKANGEQVIRPNKIGRLIRKAFHLKAEQGLSNTDIIKRLKAPGLSLLNQTLTKIFRNPFYCSLVTHAC